MGGVPEMKASLLLGVAFSLLLTVQFAAAQVGPAPTCIQLANFESSTSCGKGLYVGKSVYGCCNVYYQTDCDAYQTDSPTGCKVGCDYLGGYVGACCVAPTVTYQCATGTTIPLTTSPGTLTTPSTPGTPTTPTATAAPVSSQLPNPTTPTAVSPSAATVSLQPKAGDDVVGTAIAVGTFNYWCLGAAAAGGPFNYTIFTDLYTTSGVRNGNLTVDFSATSTYNLGRSGQVISNSTASAGGGGINPGTAPNACLASFGDYWESATGVYNNTRVTFVTWTNSTGGALGIADSCPSLLFPVRTVAPTYSMAF